MQTVFKKPVPKGIERWDAPCIVTTNVGFFEPLFSARPTDCRHLHQLADSVIVLDEAQSFCRMQTVFKKPVPKGIKR